MMVDTRQTNDNKPSIMDESEEEISPSLPAWFVHGLVDTDSDEIVYVDTYAGYTYLGVDSEGWHHHKFEDRIYVTSQSYSEYVASSGLRRIRIEGELNHVEDLSRHDNPGLEQWLAYVGQARGWDDLQVTIIGSDFMKGVTDRLDTQ